MKRICWFLALVARIHAEPAFVGLLTLPGEGERFALRSSSSEEARWLRLGDHIDGHRIAEFQAKEGVLVLTKEGQTLRLKLASSSEEQGKDIPDRFVVRVAGSVNQYGNYKLPRGARVSDAIVAAGGTTRLARIDRVVLTRTHGGERRDYALNLSKEGAPEDNMELRPEDIVYVPENVG